MNTVAPVWDGNETWLVLGGGGLMAAFPLAYAILMPALYTPIIAMLLALIFRGVAFEFRWRDPGHRAAWDFAFSFGSIVATFAQGVTLGALLQGIAVEGRGYVGGWFDWLTPFSILVGVSLLVGYALLGATWLIMKSEDSLQARCYRLAFGLGIGVITAMYAWPSVLWMCTTVLSTTRGAVPGAAPPVRRWWPILWPSRVATAWPCSTTANWRRMRTARTRPKTTSCPSSSRSARPAGVATRRFRSTPSAAR